MSAPAKVQAMEALIDAHARELHLPSIRDRFRALADEAMREQQTPLAYLAALLEAVPVLGSVIPGSTIILALSALVWVLRRRR